MDPGQHNALAALSGGGVMKVPGTGIDTEHVNVPGTGSDLDARPATVPDRLAQLEAEVADLQAWIAAVASDMLDRTT